MAHTADVCSLLSPGAKPSLMLILDTDLCSLGVDFSILLQASSLHIMGQSSWWHDSCFDRHVL